MSEKMVEEKQAQPAPTPAAPTRGRFRRIAQAWIVLMSVCWGATLGHILNGIAALNVSPVRLGGVTYGAPAMAIGLAFAGVIAFLCLKKLSGTLDYIRPGQARLVRLTAYAAVAGMAAFGCYAFYMQVTSVGSSWWQNIVGRPIFGKEFVLKPILFPSLGIFTTVMLGAFLFMNREKSAEFLIETEGELKKVSWPQRKEYLGSSLVVVVVVAVVSVFLYVVDLGLSKLMEALKIGF